MYLEHFPTPLLELPMIINDIHDKDRPFPCHYYIGLSRLYLTYIQMISDKMAIKGYLSLSMHQYYDLTMIMLYIPLASYTRLIVT